MGRSGLVRPSLETLGPDWATPTSHARTHDARRVDHGEQLANQAEMWATPTVGNVTGGNMNRGNERSDELLLPGQAEQLVSGLQAPKTSTTGPTSSSDDPTSRQPSASPNSTPSETEYISPDVERLLRRRLNPRFVELLMGWPEGWTSLAPIDCGSPETAWSRWQRRMRSELSRLTSG